MTLFRVSYLEQKNEIACMFSHEKERKVHREKFFPYAFISLEYYEIVAEKAKNFPKKISISNEKNSLKITASNYSVLKDFFSDDSFFEKPLILHPERQFLLSKDWRFFGEFIFEFNKPIKLNSLNFPDILLDEIPLNELLKEMLSVSKKSAKELIQRIVLSNLLFVPPEDVPEEKFFVTELFLQNSFFKNGFVPPKNSEKLLLPSKKEKLNLIKENLCEMNFNEIWSSIFLPEFFNLGFDSLNCNCCRPDSLSDSNILPNSLIKSVFLADGLMFSSTNSSYANEFHLNNSFQAQRKKFMAEWGLDNFPLGPFYFNQNALIPLNDAKQLFKEKKISVNFRESSIKWFCRKKNSFLSASIKSLFELDSLIEKKLGGMKNHALNSLNLGYQNELDFSPEFNYFSSFQFLIDSILNDFSLHLRSPFSRFYSSFLAEAIESVQESILLEFKQHLTEKGVKLVVLDREKVLLQAKNPLFFSRDFALKKGLPEPKIVANWDSAVL
ncbi:MAG: hypothetical protein ABIA76_05740 [Candidatus Diapherotrites archaeon]